MCGHLESGNHGDAYAANLDALSGALAGGVGHGGVSAAAGGDDLHIAAENVIACILAESSAVIDIGNVHGNRAADAQLGKVLVGGMARLGNGLGGCVQGIGFDAQILRPDSAPADAGLIAVHKHFDGDGRANGVPGRRLQAGIGAVHADERRRAVQGAVRSQIGNAAGGGMDTKRRGSADALCRIHLRKVRIVDVCDPQSANELVCDFGTCGLGSILQNLADAGGTGKYLQSLADGPIDAKHLGNEGKTVDGGQLLACRQIVEGNCQGHGAGSHIGERIHHHIVHSENLGIVINECLGGAEHEIARHEHAGGGSHVPHIGELTGGVAGAVHNAGGEHLHRSGRIHCGVVGDLRDGVKLHHGKGDGERGDTAHGVGHQVVYGAGTDEDAALSPLAAVAAAVTGDQVRLLPDGHLGVPGGNCHGDGNEGAEKLILRVDGNIHIGAGMDAAARGKIAVDGHIGIAELQGNGVKVLADEIAENLFTGNESLVENELRVQVDDLIRMNLLLFRNNNVDIFACFVEPKLDLGSVLGIQIVFHNLCFKSGQRLVLAVDGEENILRADGPEHINLLADYQKIQSFGVQPVDAQLAADGLAQIVGENDV